MRHLARQQAAAPVQCRIDAALEQPCRACPAAQEQSGSPPVIHNQADVRVRHVWKEFSNYNALTLQRRFAAPELGKGTIAGPRLTQWQRQYWLTIRNIFGCE